MANADDKKNRPELEAKVKQGLRKAFPSEATAGATASKSKKKAGKPGKPPARKSLGKTPIGGSPMEGGKTETVIQVKKVPALKMAC